MRIQDETFQNAIWFERFVISGRLIFGLGLVGRDDRSRV
jgi:hypothetical protein